MFRTRDKFSLLLWLYRRPVALFATETAILTPLILAWDHAPVAASYAFVLAGLVVALAFLNLPFVLAAFRTFSIDKATRRNHVLEHATILHLEQICGRRFSGRATRDGFRVSGRASVADITQAFEQVRRTLQAGDPLTYVTTRCGSNIVTTQGLGLLALLLVALAAVLLRPSVAVRAAALGFVIVGFVLSRRGVGNAVQRRFFMLADFHEVSLRAVRAVRPTVLERPPVHVVQTVVRVRSTSDQPSLQ